MVALNFNTEYTATKEFEKVLLCRDDKYFSNYAKFFKETSLMQQLTVFTTGGTIDKVYFDAASEFQVGHPVVEELLTKMNVSFDVKVKQIMRIDSLDMTDEHRKIIQCAVRDDNCANILITHGTDGMVETANALNQIKGKKIVLTGALQPAAFADNDAVFNIGCAVAAIQLIQDGVYIAMNGQIFAADNVIKNRSKNRFESIL